MNEFMTNLKRNIKENPVLALAAGAAVLTATAKLIDALNDTKNTQIHAKEVNRRIKKDNEK